MEPWPFSHGYDDGRAAAEVDHVPSMEPWPFSHGYMASFLPADRDLNLLQWSHGLSAMDTTIYRRSLQNRHGLQWSHGLSAMDTVKARITLLPAARALQFSHGYPRRLAGTPSPRSPFNGAMAFQPWILFTVNLTTNYTSLLQWSHGLSAMDTAGTQGHRHYTIPVASSIPGFGVPSVLCLPVFAL